MAAGPALLMRREEILSLTWEKVNLINGKITLEAGTTKNDEPGLSISPGNPARPYLTRRLSVMRNIPLPSHVLFRDGQRIYDFRGFRET